MLLLALLDRPGHNSLNGIEHRLATQPATIDRHRQKLTLAVAGDATMENQMIVASQVHRAIANNVLQVIVEFLTTQEGMLQS